MNIITMLTTLCSQTLWPNSGTCGWIFTSSQFKLVNTDNTKSFSFVSLQFAVELAALLQHPAPTKWQEVADGLKIPFDQESQYHPEFDGYIKGSFLRLLTLSYIKKNWVFIICWYVFWTSHRSSSEAGWRSYVELPSWLANVPRGQEEWPCSVWASNWPQWSSHDMGKTQLMLKLQSGVLRKKVDLGRKFE